MKHSSHYCEGVKGIRTALMLSAPGSKEKEHGWPAWADTGDNLEAILLALNERCKAVFPYAGDMSDHASYMPDTPARYYYRITNSVKKVYPNQNTRRTEPPLYEVYEESNRIRLLKDLSGIDVVVCFGDTAIKAYRHLLRYGIAALLIPGRHPGNRSLCQIDVGDDGTPEERLGKRIAIAAKEIIAYINIVDVKSHLLRRSKGE